ncbi:hypothetical protein BDV41DRAFT_460236 [Aspergillus transmontanensis]|uniref:Uncharacterized protein n=1 Tax=Aspergillus transmontanensis TaxID=1034304 RepID=A0A5N6VLJ5_9EURO|nr:hypothetical protein BDV41DRAFT_460236 [Aspergillus transmontanensis]
MSWISAISTVSQWILLYPVTFLIYYGYRLLRLLATPLVKLGQLTLRCALLPFNLVLKFEAFLTFVLAAILTGVLLGLLLYYTSSFIVEILNQSLGLTYPLPHHTQARTIKGLKRNALERGYSPLNEYLAGSSRQIRKSGLLSSTILEEEESNQDSNGDDLYD